MSSVAQLAEAAPLMEVKGHESPVEEDFVFEMRQIDLLCSASNYGDALKMVVELQLEYAERSLEIDEKMDEVLSLWGESHLIPEETDLRMLEILAVEGDSEARKLLLRANRGLSRLPQKIRAAAEKGHLPSMIELASLLEAQGQQEEAMTWFYRAAKMGSVDGMVYYGEGRLFGVGMEASPVEAVVFLDRAAAAGNGEAMNLLGIAYGSGLGVTKDGRLAFEWFEGAAALGSANACFQLGRSYEAGIGTDRDLEQAAKWYVAGAQKGDAESMVALAACFESGRGMPQNSAQAEFWYRRGAAMGNEVAAAWCRKMGLSIEVSSSS